MSAADAFFHADRDRFVATALTRGPWHIDHQHGGPPSALLARGFEALLAAEDGAWHIARTTVEFLRPLLVGVPLQVQTQVTRRSRRILGLTGTLLHDGKPLAQASALCVRRLTMAIPAEAAPADTPRAPTDFPISGFPFFRWDVGYHTAMTVRLEAGAIGRGPATAWLRPDYPLIADEPMSPLQRVLVAADAINGVGFALDLRFFTFVNADLGVHLHRPAEGEWIRMAVHPAPGPIGTGIVSAELGDVRGPIGQALEVQVLDIRTDPGQTHGPR